MKEIPLSKNGKNKGKHVAIVDDEIYDYLMQWDWHVAKFKKTNYAHRSVRLPNGKILTIRMHRVIMKVTDPSIKVDHENHNGLDNREGNLRIATGSQNNFNVSKKETPSSSPFKGVTLDKTIGLTKKWRSRIQVGRKMISLKRHATEEEAARAYDEAAKKYFGEFANLNFKEEVPTEMIGT